MRESTNYSLLLPDETDLYSIGDFNENTETIDARMKLNQTAAENAASSLNSHTASKANPHAVTKAQVGLSNVPNLSTNNQAPTYTVPSAASALASGEILSTAFGKIAKSVSDQISHLANTSNPHTVTKAQVGLGNADNTSDVNKPVSTAMQTALNGKVDKVTGKVLSTNDYTTTEKNKLAGIASGAQVNTVTGIKGNGETSYRTGNVNITPANIGLGSVNNTADSAKSVASAAKLTTARTISLTGAVTGSVSFDGSANRSIATSFADTGWRNLTLAGNVRLFLADFPIKYRRLNGVVYFKGRVTNITSASTLIGTLPEGYRPIDYSLRFTCEANGSIYGRIYVNEATGALTLESFSDGSYPSERWLSLNNITFCI